MCELHESARHALPGSDSRSPLIGGNELRRSVENRPRHLPEGVVQRLDVLFIRLHTLVMRTPVLPQPIPDVYGVVVLPVERVRPPDLVQLVEVRTIQPRRFHVDEMRVAARQVERHLARVVGPLVDAIVVEVGIHPHVQEERRVRADDDASACLRLLLLSNRAYVSPQLVERLRHEDVEIEIDPAVL